LKIKHF